MVANTSIGCVAIFVCTVFIQHAVIAGNTQRSEKEIRDCSQELDRISAMDKSLASGPTNDLSKYETFADEIQQKWRDRDKECFARLMNAACGPLSSGRFKDARQYEVARRYALSALDNRDVIPLRLELQLTGHVATRMVGPSAPKGEDFAERRRKDVEVRLHALKRLIDALDPNWDPNENLSVHPPIGPLPPGNFASGMAPREIKNDVLRAQYEAAERENRQKIERYTEQHKLRLWLQTFPKTAEDYLIQAYSHPPCNADELRKSLDEHKIDENTKARILDAVTKNCNKATK